MCRYAGPSGRRQAFSSGRQIYQFRLLPFGLNIAPRVFTKILRLVHTRLASEGVNILLYLGDGLVYAHSQRLGADRLTLTLRVDSEMGLSFNLDTSSLPPSNSAHTVAGDGLRRHERLPSPVQGQPAEAQARPRRPGT